jgi:hypothetical protein
MKEMVIPSSTDIVQNAPSSTDKVQNAVRGGNVREVPKAARKKNRRTGPKRKKERHAAEDKTDTGPSEEPSRLHAGVKKGLRHGANGLMHAAGVMYKAVDSVSMSTPAEAIVAGSMMSAIGAFLVTFNLKLFVELCTVFISTMAASYLLHMGFLPPLMKHSIPSPARYFLCVFTVIFLISITGSSNATGFHAGDTRMSMMGMGRNSGQTLTYIIILAVVVSYIVRFLGPIQSRWPLRYLSSITSLIAFLIFIILRPYERDVEPCGASRMDRSTYASNL